MAEVNKPAITEWVAALRSGEYKQGVDRLTTIHPDGSTSHCCLGVVCELLARKGVLTTLDYTLDSVGLREYKGPEGRSTYILPEAARAFLGLRDASPSVRTSAGRLSLSALNDGGEYTFSEIADLIESTYLSAGES